MYSPILARGRTIAGNLARRARGLDKGKTAQLALDVAAFGVGSYLGLKSLFVIVQKDWLSPKWATIALAGVSGLCAWGLWRKLQTLPAKAVKRKAYRTALASVVGYVGAAVYSGITLAENGRATRPPTTWMMSRCPMSAWKNFRESLTAPAPTWPRSSMTTTPDRPARCRSSPIPPRTRKLCTSPLDSLALSCASP